MKNTKINSFLLVIIYVSQVYCDLPIHCLKSQIEGKWSFELEDKKKDMNPLENSCGHQQPDNEKTSHLSKLSTFKPTSSFSLNLNPDGTVTSMNPRLTNMFRMKAVNANMELNIDQKAQMEELIKQSNAQKHQRFTKDNTNAFMRLVNNMNYKTRFYDDLWTMIYDEGFEINYQHQRIFLYNQYYADPKNATNILSNCSSTIVGWYHDYSTNEYTCIKGTKVSNGQPSRFSQAETEKTETESVAGPYLPGDFTDHQAMADKLNALHLSWTSGVSEDFLGMTVDELNRMAGRKASLKQFQQYSFKTTKQGYLKNVEEDLSDLPDQFSWEEALGKVKNQGRCGSCYIFALLEMLHARLRILYGVEVELSYQHAMDCMYYNQGCEGGFPTLVSKFGNEVGFIPYSCKPYTGKKGECNKICQTDSLKQIYKVGEYGYVNAVYGQTSERVIMQELIKNGPVTLSLDVDYQFMIYKSGVFSRAPASWYTKGQSRPQWTKLAHSVVCFGWGIDHSSGKKYWLIRNSWGDKWGEKGHMRIERGIDVLGIESSPEYAIPIVVDTHQYSLHNTHFSFYNQS